MRPAFPYIGEIIFSNHLRCVSLLVSAVPCCYKLVNFENLLEQSRDWNLEVGEPKKIKKRLVEYSLSSSHAYFFKKLTCFTLILLERQFLRFCCFRLAEEKKEEGNQLYKGKQYRDALSKYSEAIGEMWDVRSFSCNPTPTMHQPVASLSLTRAELQDGEWDLK